MTTIIDYGLGNITSVEKACNYLGERTIITSDINIINQAKRIILPGVGGCLDAMDNLKKLGLTEVIKCKIDDNTPFLGICLGMQLLFEHSHEGYCDALSVLGGNVLKIPSDAGRKVPQIGWNDVSVTQGSRLFNGIPNGSYFYFVHSYYVSAADNDCVAGTTDYGAQIHSAIEWGNLFAVQFHPEKSGETGLKLLKNFLTIGE